MTPRWKLCVCGEWWCRRHCKHVFECDCPPVDKLNFDPYAEDRR